MKSPVTIVKERCEFMVRDPKTSVAVIAILTTIVGGVSLLKWQLHVHRKETRKSASGPFDQHLMDELDHPQIEVVREGKEETSGGINAGLEKSFFGANTVFELSTHDTKVTTSDVLDLAKRALRNTLSKAS